MNWDAIQNDAKAKGHLVFAVDQAQTAVLTEPGPWGSAFDGYCIGLCANWVSLQYQGKNFPIAADKTCDNPPWQSTQAQNLSDASKSADWTGWWKVASPPSPAAFRTGCAHRARPSPPPISCGPSWRRLTGAMVCTSAALVGRTQSR